MFFFFKARNSCALFLTTADYRPSNLLSWWCLSSLNCMVSGLVCGQWSEQQKYQSPRQGIAPPPFFLTTTGDARTEDENCLSRGGKGRKKPMLNELKSLSFGFFAFFSLINSLKRCWDHEIFVKTTTAEIARFIKVIRCNSMSGAVVLLLEWISLSLATFHQTLRKYRKTYLLIRQLLIPPISLIDIDIDIKLALCLEH